MCVDLPVTYQPIESGKVLRFQCCPIRLLIIIFESNLGDRDTQYFSHTSRGQQIVFKVDEGL